jgi:signal peptidase I
MGMTRRALRMLPALALVGALGGCGVERGLYYLATQRAMKVTTEGMLPTLKPGDRIMVDTTFYANNPVRRFDVIIFTQRPENVPDVPGIDKDSPYVQRVVGLGGETVEVKGGEVYINGQWLAEPFATIAPVTREDYGPFKIPEGELFVMGDNRPNSYDSRHWPSPTLGKQQIFGKVVQHFPQ